MNCRLGLLSVFCGITFSSQNCLAARFNDTGLTNCVINDRVTTDCTGSGQDAEYGRDSSSRSDKNGEAGFTFVKLDDLGNELPNGASRWTCVKDKVTGLVWESKNVDGSNLLHYYANDFTFLDLETIAGPSDVRYFIPKVNAENYCGFSDWRLPSKEEAATLTSYALVRKGRRYDVQAIDPVFFPEPSTAQWTTECSTVGDGSGSYDCILTQWVTGQAYRAWRYDEHPVRLVRGAHFVSDLKRYVSTGSEVRDKVSGITWSRCTEGQSWLGSTCVGEGNTYTWPQALEIARSRSLQTGQVWRIPNMKELLSVGNFPDGASVIAFPNPATDQYTWSSTLGYDQDLMRGAIFGRVYDYSINRSTGSGYVRLVRD